MPAELDVDGATQVATNIRHIGDRATDAKPAMQKVKGIIETANRRQMQTSGAYLGESWAELKPGTLARKARKGQDSRILRATGDLEASLTGGKGKRTSATKTMARAGTSLFYGRFAQAGTEGAGHGASEPQRRIVGLTRRDVTKGVRVIEKFVLTGEVFP